MIIQCDCGQFQAELSGFPKNTPGRLACYCDDCQTYLHYLGRADLLNSAGGTEIIPVYPSEFRFLKGQENLKPIKLSPNGLLRWSTTCCKTPIANTRPKFPWAGVVHRVFNVKDPGYLDKTLGPVKSAIHGRFAKGTPPPGTSMKLSFGDFLTVFPFLLKGFLLKKTKNSPFFAEDGVTPIAPPETISLETRNSIRQKLGF